jgi:hypothetical protein
MPYSPPASGIATPAHMYRVSAKYGIIVADLRALQQRQHRRVVVQRLDVAGHGRVRRAQRHAAGACAQQQELGGRRARARVLLRDLCVVRVADLRRTRRLHPWPALRPSCSS